MLVERQVALPVVEGSSYDTTPDVVQFARGPAITSYPVGAMMTHTAVCACCGIDGLPATSIRDALHYASMVGWDVPPADLLNEGYCRCPCCVHANVWPDECLAGARVTLAAAMGGTC